MLNRLDDAWPAEMAAKQFRDADNMTDQMGALLALRDRDGQERDDCLTDFASRWQNEALVMDKFFMLIGGSQLEGTLQRVEAALQHPAFSIKNPNKVRSLLGPSAPTCTTSTPPTAAATASWRTASWSWILSIRRPPAA